MDFYTVTLTLLALLAAVVTIGTVTIATLVGRVRALDRQALTDPLTGAFNRRYFDVCLDAAIERALMFLHEQRVIVLQQGLAVFRSAMTIRFQPERRGEKYKVSDHQPLEHHYKERILQVHVMSEYARLGLERIQAALSRLQ